MEVTAFHQLLEQPPRPQVIENSPIPPYEQNPKDISPHKWTARELRKFASDVHDFLRGLDDTVQDSETFTAYIDEIGKYGLDDFFSGGAEEDIENCRHSVELYFREARRFATKMSQLEEGWSINISKLNQRTDIPKQLSRRLNATLAQVQQIHSRFEKSWAILKSNEIPLRSSILLALAKFRELTIEEKKVLLKSAVFHGPIDNLPSDNREDWYDDHGQ